MTTTQATTDLPGMTLQFYPPRIGDRALSDLADLAGELEETAPKFVAWLRSWCQQENCRRLDASYAVLGMDAFEVREVELPRMPFHKWSNHDLADALEGVTVLSYAVRNPEVGEFCDKLIMFITTTAAFRLRRKQ